MLTDIKQTYSKHINDGTVKIHRAKPALNSGVPNTYSIFKLNYPWSRRPQFGNYCNLIVVYCSLTLSSIFGT